jgi:hypothetical protein
MISFTIYQQELRLYKFTCVSFCVLFNLYYQTLWNSILIAKKKYFNNSKLRNLKCIWQSIFVLTRLLK